MTGTGPGVVVQTEHCRIECESCTIPHGPHSWAVGVRATVTHLPSGTVAVCEASQRYFAIEDAINELTNRMATAEQHALADALGIVSLTGDDYACDNTHRHVAAAAVLDCLHENGWQLKKGEL